MKKTEIIAQIEQHWRTRARIQGLAQTTRSGRPTKAYLKAELEFFCGAMAALDACGKWPPPPSWAVPAMRGEAIVKDHSHA